jgi:hypothetical protein
MATMRPSCTRIVAPTAGAPVPSQTVAPVNAVVGTWAVEQETTTAVKASIGSARLIIGRMSGKGGRGPYGGPVRLAKPSLVPPGAAAHLAGRGAAGDLLAALGAPLYLGSCTASKSRCGTGTFSMSTT